MQEMDGSWKGNLKQGKRMELWSSLLLPIFVSLKQSLIWQQQILKMRLDEQPDFNKAVQELKIRMKNDQADKEEVAKVLFQILGYPSTGQAEEHHRANNLGTLDLLQKQEELERSLRNNEQEDLKICQCCGLMVKNEPLPYCVNFKDLKIGMGIILFFRNYIFNFLVLFLMFCIYGIFSLVTNIQSSNLTGTKQKLCNIDEDQGQILSDCLIAGMGGGAKLFSADSNEIKDYYSRIQSILGIVIVALWGLLLMIKRHSQKKYIFQMETKRISASSFTLMITHFPKFYLARSYEQNLKEIQGIFKKYGQNVNSDFSYEVVKYNVGKPLYLDEKEHKKTNKLKQKERNDRQQIFRNWIRYRRKHQDFPIPFADRSKQYDKYVNFYSSKYDVKKEREYRLDQKNLLFVTMRSSSAMREICQLNPVPSIKNLWNCCSKTMKFPIKDVKIRKAPEPEEIKFNNVGFPVNKKYFRKALIWIITIVLIGISIGISIGIGYVNVDQTQVGEETRIAISVGISLVVTVINLGIQLSIMNLTYFENQYIKSVEQIQIAIKIAIGQIINSIGVPIIVAAVASSDPRLEDKKWLSTGGLVNDVFFIALFGLATPFGRFLDPWEFLLKFLRWFHTRPQQKLKMNGQKELNEYFGNYQFDIGYEYAYLIKTVIFTAFFACLQPIIILFGCIGIILYYLADRRNLLRHFRRQGFHFHTIDHAVDFFLLFAPVAFGFGNLFVNNFLSDEFGTHDNNTLIINWIIVAVAAFFVIIVPLNIFYCCIKKPEHPQWDYFQKRALIPTDYDRINPQTKSKALSEFEDYLNKLNRQDNLPEDGKLGLFMASNIRMADDYEHERKEFTSSRLNPSMFSNPNMQNNKRNPIRYNTDIHSYESYIRHTNNNNNQPDSSQNLNDRDF